MIASQGSMEKPKTEINDDHNSPVQHNVRYDIQSNNEKISGMDPSQDAVSNVKLSKQINSSNNISRKSNANQGNNKSRSSNHNISDAVNKLNKIKSQNTTSQVRFAYGTGESFDNQDKKMISGFNANARVNSS